MRNMAVLHAAHSSKYILPVTRFTHIPAGYAVLSTRGGKCVKSLGFDTIHNLQQLPSPLGCTLSFADDTGTGAPHSLISERKAIVKCRIHGGSCVRVHAIGRVASKLNVLKSKQCMLHTSLWCDFMSRDRLRVVEFERFVSVARLGGEPLGVAQNTASNSGRQLSGIHWMRESFLEEVEDNREFEANYGRAQSFSASPSVQRVLADKDLSMGLQLNPIVVKRNSKIPVNWNGPGGTVVLIDKPKGWTSFDVCGKLRSLLRVKKVGHAGTLDPMATGLLVVCVGKATKLADSYQALTKAYSGTMRLGELTPSYDADTPVSETRPWEHIEDADLERAKQAFIGDIMQVPPIFSAIKVGGERLYQKARRGEEVAINPRPVTIYNFQVKRSQADRQNVDFEVVCSKGTYIRSLCADFAMSIDSYGHLTALRREKIGDLSVEDAWQVSKLVEQYRSL